MKKILFAIILLGIFYFLGIEKTNADTIYSNCDITDPITKTFPNNTIQISCPSTGTLSSPHTSYGAKTKIQNPNNLNYPIYVTLKSLGGSSQTYLSCFLNNWELPQGGTTADYFFINPTPVEIVVGDRPYYQTYTDSACTTAVPNEFTIPATELNSAYMFYYWEAFTPPSTETRITEIVNPELNDLPMASTTVNFNFKYWNGNEIVSTAYAEVQDITAGIQYIPIKTAPTASGENTYSENMLLTAENLHMWRAVLDFGTTSPKIYGNWITFDVITPSGQFTPDPRFWGEYNPWDIGATSTALNASTTCAGVDNTFLVHQACEIVAFLFIPPPFANQYITNLVNNFYNAFPFNLLFLGTQTLYELNNFNWSTYTGDEEAVITLAFGEATSTQMIGNITLVSKDTISNMIPLSVQSTVRSVLEIAIYLFFVTSLVFGVSKLFTK